ncbi:MAG: putative porin [Acidobacteriota bacterium]
MKIKRLLAVVIITLLSLNSVTFAYGDNEGDGKTKKSGTGETPATEVKSANETNLSAEEKLLLLTEKVRKLEEIIEQQQQILESMQSKPTTDAANVAVTTVPATAPKTQVAPDEQIKKVDALYKAYGQLNISGDLRFRYDGQFDQGFDSPVDVPDRNRLRVRARVQFAGHFQDHFDWAIRLASGRFTVPTATNQDVSDFFNRKPIGFDRYFIRYNSKTEPYGVILQAGKFDYPWKRTMLTFDDNMQPEGAAETVYYKGKGLLQEAKLVAFQLPFNEASAGKDSVLYGGQLQSVLGRGSWVLTNSITLLNFNQADTIARSVNKPTTQIGGGFEFGTTNRVRRDANGNVVGFVTNYNILDVIGEVGFKGFQKFPIVLTLNYARNLSNRLDRLKERNAYWAEIKVGRLKEKGDMEFGYIFARTEQDAVLSVFNYIDFLGTNSRNNRVAFGYTLNNNVYVQFFGIFNERFNTLPKSESRVQKRFQFDVNYRF